MSTQLHQAVQLAQTGQRNEARQLLWQFLQTEPNNEVAWLWLASVAADQGEYRRALNEVLRINPGNPRAQQLLADLDRQYGPPPPAAQPYLSTQQPASLSPQSPYAPPPIYGQQVSPPPPRPQYPVSAPIEVQVVSTVEKRRGCLGCALPVLPIVPGCGGCLGCGGCGQGCMLAFLVLVIVPALLCAGLSFSPISLGPFDVPAGYFPGEMGRKNIEFTTANYEVDLKAPRNWYLVQMNDQMWEVWEGFLEGTIPFEEAERAWSDLGTATGTDALIVDVNPANLTDGGDLVRLVLRSGTQTGDYDCDAVEGSLPTESVDYPVLFRYDNNLCGYRQPDEIQSGPTARVLKNIAPPEQIRTIEFFVPLNATTASRWQITLPEELYGRYEDDITALIESVAIQQK